MRWGVYSHYVRVVLSDRWLSASSPDQISVLFKSALSGSFIQTHRKDSKRLKVCTFTHRCVVVSHAIAKKKIMHRCITLLQYSVYKVVFSMDCVLWLMLVKWFTPVFVCLLFSSCIYVQLFCLLICPCVFFFLFVFLLIYICWFVIICYCAVVFMLICLLLLYIFMCFLLLCSLSCVGVCLLIYTLCVCVCVCVHAFLWQMRTYICIMTGMT